ncbi:MAG: hypothetical protein KDB80_04580, partial [Planctomycetes bacterium]|nr:hypothetical protein [Planctomycetota bacterium]
MSGDGGRRDGYAMLGILGVAVLAYGSALFGHMVYDDLHSVRDNPALRSLTSIPRFFWDVDAFSSIQVRMYRPILLLTFAIDWFLGQGSAWVFKSTNVLLHATSALLVFSIARKFSISRRAAWIAAAMFAAHPLASEAVNMISSRSDVLAACGVLLGVRAYISWQDGSRFAWIAVAVGALVACGSKATGVMLAPMCVVLEIVRPGRVDWRTRSVRQLPVLLVTIAYLVARRELFGVATARAPILTGGHDVLNGAGRDLVTQACVMSNVLPRFVVQSF